MIDPTGPRIFVSYRRNDDEQAVRGLTDELRSAFGTEQVFLDAESIAPGADFAGALLAALRRCDVLIVVIGPEWLRVAKGSLRRLADPMDYVRMELAEGISRAVPILPVLVGGASMPAEDDLPEKVRLIHRRQALVIGDDSAGRDRSILVALVRTLLDKADEERAKQGRGSVRDYFEVVLPHQLRLRGERAGALAGEASGTVLFNVRGTESGSWAIVLDPSGPRVERSAPAQAELVINVTDGAMRDMLFGRFDARAAVARGEIELAGDLKLLRHIASFVFGA